MFLDKMVSVHKYTKHDIDHLIPFERDILTTLINDRINTSSNTDGDWTVQQEAPTD